LEFSFDNLINTVFYVGALQGVILSLFLFSVKANVISNRLLGILTFSWAVILTVFALQSEGLYRDFPHLLRTFVHLILTWFPLLYLSLKYLISSHKRFVTKDLLHFVPFALSILLHSGFFFKSADEKVVLNQSTDGYYFVIDILFQEFIGLQGVVYSILSLILLRKYKNSVINFQSNIYSRVLNAYKVGIIISLSSWSIGIVAVHLEMFGINPGVDLFVFVYLAFVIIIYLISILMIRSPEIFKLSEAELNARNNNFTETEVESENRTNSDYSKKPDAVDQSEQDFFLVDINEKLSVIMEKQKPYLNPDLSLQDLAKILDISRHNLSAVINNYRKMNFYEFVNSYRVEEVKQLMKNKQNQRDKVMNLAYDAGFNSNASFYRIFKNITGQTPTQFRSSLQD